ncbi:transcriptional regulator, LuxR family [Thioalkalivibrio sulfidiphilus HL-EbGr7]|uniref:Transcriptional regulator, LuxR family n=1 Tax=Thioalkalivibrio sulfidiphilus (strain HL-EbGR7) TaxID=396588 RepID=B8GPW3_THISH|nr:LuxR C-terminal-related transcriptional regulator [Thioalkalivibrio sulfidiphilus]ACL74110.1 transcriptional regulator, LuxR family [Thioalkalivibrio sulfidiphilus HL-EbGr7]
MNERQTLIHLDRRTPRLLDTLYETVDHPEVWQRFLDELVEASHGRSARLLFLNDRADQVNTSHKVNIDDDAHQAYVGHFVNTCPWRPELVQKRPGRIYSTFLDFSCRQPEFYRTEFFNDWARGLDIHHGICGTVFQETGLTVQLLVQRTRDQGYFTADETESINRLIPHIQRGLHLSRQLQAMRQEVAAVRDVADRQGLPFLLLGENGEVNFVSEAARHLIEHCDQLRLAENRLHIAGQPADRSLRRRILRQMAHQAQGSARPSSLRIPRAGMPDLQLILSPLHPDMPALQLVPVPSHMAVFIHDALRAPEMDRELLMEMYGLTAAEARTAALVAQGQDVPEIATHAGTSANTIRTQLKQCFRKTGTRRQSELACVLLTGGARLDRRDSYTVQDADTAGSLRRTA